MKKLLISALVLIAGTCAFAQEKINAGIGADFVSHYIWRGLDAGNVSIQPALDVGCKGWNLSAWGSVGVSHEDTKEFDLTASYTFGGLTVSITDYWFDSPQERYFRYKAHDTSHVFEASLAYDFGFMSAAWFTNFAGNDGTNGSGDRAYSSYFELNVPFRLASADWTGTLGAVPFASSFYDVEGFAVTNVALKASKDIKITESFSVPVFAQIIANPSSEKAWFVFGFTLRP